MTINASQQNVAIKSDTNNKLSNEIGAPIHLKPVLKRSRLSETPTPKNDATNLIFSMFEPNMKSLAKCIVEQIKNNKQIQFSNIHTGNVSKKRKISSIEYKENFGSPKY